MLLQQSVFHSFAQVFFKGTPVLAWPRLLALFQNHLKVIIQ